VRQASLACDAERLYGVPFARVFDVPPASAFLAEGSAVAVFRGRRIRQTEAALVAPRPR
jgi:hypothetical protein